MHFTVSWDISAKEPQWSAIDEQMRNCFKNYPQVRPVNTYYMVKVTSARDYDQIHNALLNIAQNSSITIYFIMSPLLNTSGYKGWLPQDTWTKIAQITS
jgi:hypothetical protein